MPDPLRIGISSGFVPSNNNLKNVNAGSSLKESVINNSNKAIVKNTIKQSKDYNIKQSAEGTTLHLRAQNNVIGYGDSPLTANFGNGKVYVTAGMVNLEMPQINGRYLDEIDNSGEPPYLTVNATGFICVKVYAQAGKPFPSAIPEIVFHSGSLEQTDSYCLIPLARLYVKSQTQYAFSQLSRGNLRVFRIKSGSQTAIWNWTNYGY